MLVIVWQPGRKRQLGLLLILLLLMGALIAGLPWAIDRFGPPRGFWTTDQLARAVERGAVERITLRGSEATVETKADERFRVRWETGDSIIEFLRSLEVLAERLQHIEILVVPPSPTVLVWLSRWGLAVPILILLLYLASRITSPRDQQSSGQ